MKAGFSRDSSPGDDLDPGHGAVWHLVGRAPLPEPDAWFAARTLARCRSEKRAAFVRVWRWALGGGMGVCLAAGLLVAQLHVGKTSRQKNVQEAFEVMASIDSSDSDSSTPSPQDSSL